MAKEVGIKQNAFYNQCEAAHRWSRGGTVSEDVAEILGTGPSSAFRIEQNGINVIAESERKGRPRELFWPWFGANISVLGLSYGSFVLAFRISFVQAIIVGAIGIVASFWLCGVIATAGTRGSAPTMVLSRAAYGVRGNRLPSAISWLLCVGWETALTVIAVLATSTVFARLGFHGSVALKIVAMLVVAGLIIGGGVMGFDLIMRMQAVITIVTGVLTIVFIALTLHHIKWHLVAHIGSGSAQSTLGRFGVLDDRLRAWLGQCRCRLFALSSTQRVDQGRRVVDHVSAGRSLRSSCCSSDCSSLDRPRH